MDYNKVNKAVSRIIDENDPSKASKELQIRQWCSAFLKLFNSKDERELTFFLDVLSDKVCWEESDTVHGIKLNRRMTAKMMLQPRSWKGTVNPLDDFERYQLACWCCLEEDILTLFQHFMKEKKLKPGDSYALKCFVKSLSGDLEYLTDSMMEFWSHVMSGCVLDLNLQGRNLFEYGLDCVLGKMYFKHVEAVEFFWLKIKAVPENELSSQQKDEIFMKSVVHASASTCGSQPEIFEFCFNQISPDKYPELLKRDFEANGYYASFNRLRNAFRFDLFQKLFDCLEPSDISEDQYSQWLRLLKIKRCPQHYEYVAVKLFEHMWKREGFDSHRSLVEREEFADCSTQGKFLESPGSNNNMELVWAMLDKASPSKFLLQ